MKFRDIYLVRTRRAPVVIPESFVPKVWPTFCVHLFYFEIVISGFSFLVFIVLEM